MEQSESSYTLGITWLCQGLRASKLVLYLLSSIVHISL